MNRTLLVFAILIAVATSSLAADWPKDFPKEGPCTVCTRRGATHGAEHFVDWREHGEERFGFCSESCVEAFDQMPEGYATPTLPRPAPEFTWETLKGDSIAKGETTALLVDFWATWCAPCIETMPELEALAEEYGDAGLKVVGVSIDEKRRDLDKFLKRRPVGYSIVHDGGEDPAWWTFKVPAIPALFLIDEQGAIVAQWSGKVEPAELKAAVLKLVGESADGD